MAVIRESGEQSLDSKEPSTGFFTVKPRIAAVGEIGEEGARSRAKSEQPRIVLVGI